MYKVKIIFSNGSCELHEGFKTYNDACNAAYNLFAEDLYRGAYDFKVIL